MFEQFLCMTSHCVGHRYRLEKVRDTPFQHSRTTLKIGPQLHSTFWNISNLAIYSLALYSKCLVNFTYLCCLNNFPSHRCLWQVINSILLTSLLLPTKELASGFCFREDEVLNQNELHQSLHCSLWISSVSFGFSP